MDELKRRNTGFTLLELMLVVLILGILALAAIQLIQPFTKEVREASLKSDLHGLRYQILLYQLHHNGNPPTPDQLYEMMMNRTAPDGSLVREGGVGPYLLKFPKNPYNGRMDVKAIPAGGALLPDDSSGWLYAVEGSDFTIAANSSGVDRSGIPLIHY